MADYVCTNPNCDSYGQAHPNCRCDAPEGHYDSGGIVHFCTGGHAHASSCEHFADGGTAESNHAFASNPDLAVDNAVMHQGLLHTLSRTGYTKSTEVGRAHREHLDAHRHGQKLIKHHMNEILEQPEPYKHDKTRTDALESKLDGLRANPDKALNIGGDLGDTLPMHHAALAAKAGTAMTYLDSIKPKPVQAAPLDPAMPPSRLDEKMYKRQVAIAEDPRMFIKHLNDGSVVPQDLVTLGTLYPKLQQSMQDHAMETLANAKASGRELTHKQKRKLGVLLGQPVLFQQSPQAMQAILHANAPAAPPPQPGKSPKKASAVELRQIDKTNQMAMTPLQRLQARQK